MVTTPSGTGDLGREQPPCPRAWVLSTHREWGRASALPDPLRSVVTGLEDVLGLGREKGLGGCVKSGGGVCGSETSLRGL